MNTIGIDTRDTRVRIHIRAGGHDGDELVAYGLPRHLDKLPTDAEARIRRVLSNHDITQYPEGAYIGSFGSATLEDEKMSGIREIVSEPYPSDIDLTEFPPEEGQLYKW